MKIHSPAEDYTGTDHYGATTLAFRNGVADHDGDLPVGVRQYLVGAGYRLDEGAAPTDVEPEVVVEPVTETPAEPVLDPEAAPADAATEPVADEDAAQEPTTISHTWGGQS